MLAKPGTRRIYSNYGFAVLAKMVQQASEIEFGHYLTEAVLRTPGNDDHPARRRRAGRRIRGDVDSRGPGGVRR